MFALSVRIDGKAQIIDLNDSQAAMLRDKLQKKECQDEFVTLGLVTFKIRQIASLFSKDQKMGTKNKIRDELRSAAERCAKCNHVGFVNAFYFNGVRIFSWKVGCDITVEVCTCQKVVKELNGIEAENFDKLYAEFDLNA